MSIQKDYTGKFVVRNRTNEIQRILELSKLDLDYTRQHDKLKDFNKMAARVTGTQYSLVNLVDAHIQWSVSNYGLGNGPLPREDSICQYTILEDDHLEISRLKKDSRFNQKSYVTSGPKLEYYCGVPLTTESGFNIGALCVLDSKPMKLSGEKIEALKMIAQSISKRLQTQFQIRDLNKRTTEFVEMPRKLLLDIRGPVAGIIGLAENLNEIAEQKKLEEIQALTTHIRNSGNAALDVAHKYLTKIQYPPKHDNDWDTDTDQVNLLLLHQKLLRMFETQAEKSGLDLNIMISKENAGLYFSRSNLLPILGNLISNAIRFTPEGGKITIDLTLKERKGGRPGTSSHTLYISVQDTGTGLNSREFRKIKTRDFKSGINFTRYACSVDEYCFSLQLVKYLVQKLNGELRIWSAANRGAHSEVLIPLDI